MLVGTLCGWVAKSAVDDPLVASLRKFRDVKFEIKERLRFYSNIYSNPGFSKEEMLEKTALELS